MTNLLAALFGNRFSVRDSSRRYLAQQLVFYGVDVSKMPPGLVQELADHAIQLSKTNAKGGDWHGTLKDVLEIEAVNISYLLDHGDVAGRQMVGRDYLQSIVPIFSRYGVPIPDVR
jgi:hypothetical protein